MIAFVAIVANPFKYTDKMKKKKITYGVYGMMEMETVIKIGGAKMKVLFTGGSMTAMGVNPAKFTTDSLLTQQAIENSQQFKKGLIKKINIIELNEEVKILRNPAPVPKREIEAPAVADEVSSPQPPMEAPAEAEQPEKETEEISNDNSSETSEEASPAAGDGLLQVEFSLNEDAKDYLEQNFGVNKAKLKNRPEIIACAKENGVDLIFV